jgi:hypothetical protein
MTKEENVTNLNEQQNKEEEAARTNTKQHNDEEHTRSPKTKCKGKEAGHVRAATH